MASFQREPDDVISSNGSNNHANKTYTNDSHHHHKHHHRHQKSHHHHHHRHHRRNQHNHHKRHVSKPDGLKTLDVDEFFEYPLPDNSSEEQSDSNDHKVERRKFSIPEKRSFHNNLSVGLSKSLPSNITICNNISMPSEESNENEIFPLQIEENDKEEMYTLTHLEMENGSETNEISRILRTVSMNEDDIQLNFKRPLEDLHQVKTYKDNSVTAITSKQKLPIPNSISPRSRRLSKSMCRKIDSSLLSKEEEIIKTIEKYINSCNINYEEVEKEINNTFSKLSLCLNHRRKILIEEAKQMRDIKVKSLNDKKKLYTIGNINRSSTMTNISAFSKENDIEHATPASQADNLEDSYKIHEPWNDSSTIYVFKDHQSSERDSSASNSSENHNGNQDRVSFAIGGSSYTNAGHRGFENGNELRKDTSSSSSGYSTPSPKFDEFHPPPSSFFSIDELEEGNMTFTYDNDRDLNFISNIGGLTEDLSSSKYTRTEGLTESGGIIGEKVDFEVHTKDKQGNPNSHSADRVVVRVYDCNRNKVQVNEESICSSSQQHIPHRGRQGKSAPTDVHCYSFIPLNPGNHEIVVKLNDIHISSSPHKFLAYPRRNLTFTSLPKMFGENKTHHFPISRSTSKDSRESNSEVDEDDHNDEDGEDECHPQSMNVSDSWVIQKDHKSSLLRSLRNHPSDIYANEPVSGICGWQMRITTACMHIKLSIGVRTCFGFMDLDEQYTCDFDLDKFLDVAYSLDHVNHALPHHEQHSGIQRKSSTFSRLSWTFTMLLNDDVLRVTCYELQQDKMIDINMRSEFLLHPYCSMIHHHSDDAGTQFCPRPQLMFL